MKIRRKDSIKPDKSDTNKVPVAQQEEFTDINASAPKRQTNKPQKLEEIYSTKDKQVKYKKLTPIEAEQEAMRMAIAKKKLTSGKGEIALTKPNEQAKIVEIASDYEEGTVIADDVIDEVDEFFSARNVYVQDIEDIDVDLNPDAAIKRYERQVNSKTRYEERHADIADNGFNKYSKSDYTEKQVTKIPVYKHDSKVNIIHLKEGRFTDVVEREYDEYLKSNDPTISKRRKNITDRIDQRQSLLYTLSQMAHHRQTQSKDTDTHQSDKVNDSVSNYDVVEEPPKSGRSKLGKFVKILGVLVKANHNKSKSDDMYPQNSGKPVDFQNKLEPKQALKDIKANIIKLKWKSVGLLVCFVVLLVLDIAEKTTGKGMFSSISNASVLYTVINLLLLVVSGVLSKRFIIGGLRPLKHFRGNSDTAVSVAYCVCAVQTVLAVFFSDMFMGGALHLYTTIVVLGLMLNTVGRLVMTSRVKSNLKFITSKSPTYAVKIFKDEDTARKMLSGTAASRSVVAYQHPTDFLGDFLKISYAPDPSEDMAGRLAPITIICAAFVCVVYGVVFKSILGALSALAVMCCVAIPVCALLACNIPLKILCKRTLKNSAMISGYPSVRQFCDSSAVMVNASELYPPTSIKADDIKVCAEFRVEESLLYAAVVLKEANSPLMSIFQKTLSENVHNLPQVESVMYEDKLGLVGWIAGERVLIGSKKLLDRYHTPVDTDIDESIYKKQGKKVTYIACSGQLVAVVIATYTPDPKVKRWLRNAEENGLCVVVSTTDNNVTADLIADDYQVFYRTVKVLNTGFANTCNEVCSQKEDISRAYLATRGKAHSMLCAVSGCVRLKSNLLLGMIVQVFGLILGVLLCATIALYATVSMLGTVEILLYILFWGLATIAAELAVKP